MRPGFNVVGLAFRSALNAHERAFRRLTLNRSTRLQMMAAPGSTLNPYIVKGRRAESFQDMAGGQVCASSGLWYPASSLVRVSGRSFGFDMAPKAAPKEEEELG